ncbi:MAG TPA: aminopeptidase P family protein [Desulfobacterales bacterium]
MTLERIQQVRMRYPEAGIDTLLVLVDENRRYLSGFTGEDTQFDESAGALLISASELILATDSRYELQAEREAPLFRVIQYREGLDRELPALLKTLNTSVLGFESVRMSVRQHEKIRRALDESGVAVTLNPVTDLVEDLRIAKDESEIRTLRNALAIAESAFENVCRRIRPGMREKELAWMMEQSMREAGADSLSFPVIVASGPNAALPHAIPGERKIRKGEPILFDWGARLQGYCSDISRTVMIGEPDETFRRVFQTVLDAQQLAIGSIQAGVSSKAVDKIARDHIERQGFGGKFGHGLGHGTGLAIHEAPRLSPLKDTRLAPGMVTTVEPGIYLPDWGGVRIENMVVVRENSCEVLNQSDPGFHRI